MGNLVNLLAALPKTKRDVAHRACARNHSVVATAKQYGQKYFDGARIYGYGGYKYDGRWRPVARDIIDHFYLKTGDRVLDVGCAKGFLVSDLCDGAYLVEAFGLDVSHYAVVECPHPDVVGRLHVGSADALPFPDKSFDLVVSINTLHNLPRQGVIAALREMRRVSRGGMFVQVDSYRTPEEKAIFEDWVLTAEFHGYPDDWARVFAEAGYEGDYAWTIVEVT